MATSNVTRLPGWLTVTQAAAQLGYSTETLRRRIGDGTVPAVKAGGSWFVSVETVNAAAAQSDGAR
jgi:excisionase family DNA binding protein